jgi:hypothetical protein
VSARIAYLERGDRGDSLAGIRLVGPHTDDSWTAPAPTDGEFGPDVVSHARHCAAEGATWLSASLRDGRNALAGVCVDVEGGVCTWVDSPSSAPQDVAAEYAQIGGGESTALLASPELSTIEAMDGAVLDPEAATSRLGVIATPDSVPRLVLDELDQRGVDAKRVLSIWQAIAETWDPSGPASQLARAPSERRAERELIAGEAPVTAIVVIEPRGRLLWVWSRSGRVLAGGSVRLETGGNGPVVTRADASRLATDWLAWSAQCAEAPGRVLCVTTELAQDKNRDKNPDEDGVATSNGSTGAALGASAFGERLGEALPGASVQMIVESDPVGETLERLARLAEETDPPGEGITLLSRAPGRAHRSLYNWISLALIAAGAGMLSLAWRANARVGEVREAVVSQEGVQDELLIEAGRQDFVDDPFAVVRLYEERETARRARPSTGPDRPIRPILKELENIALAIGTVNDPAYGMVEEPIRLQAIKLNTLTASIEIWAVDAATAFVVQEEIEAWTRALDWEAPDRANRSEQGGKSKFQILGNWPRQESGT